MGEEYYEPQGSVNMLCSGSLPGCGLCIQLVKVVVEAKYCTSSFQSVCNSSLFCLDVQLDAKDAFFRVLF